jgi:adenylate cyclase
VLVSESTFSRGQGLAQTGEPFPLYVKGKSDAIVVREVLELPQAGKSVPRCDIRKSPRFEVEVKFSYQVIQTDVTMPQSHEGIARVLGCPGLLAELEERLAPGVEVKIAIELPLVNQRASDIYGRVKKCSGKRGRYLCGMGFTALSSKTRSSIELLVQLLMQVAEAA